MAVIPDKTFKLETPTSATDSAYEEFEFLLAWYGRDGSYLGSYLFTDWEESQEVRSNVINLQTEAKLQNIINSEQRPVQLVAEDLTLNDSKVLSSIYVAKKIIRAFKDGTTERIGLDGNGRTWRQTNGRYNLMIDVIQYELALAK